MIHFLQPIGLLALTGVAIPVIVHLWNDRRGKVLRVGSVALLDGVSRRLSWSRELTQRLLLVLRCLMVLLLAGLLAGPYWLASSRAKGWVLLAGDEAARWGIAGDGDQREIDSLIGVGYERHVMDSGLNYWEAFRRMDERAPAGVAFFVFTPGLVGRFSGERPVTHRDVHWKVYTPRDSVREWLAGVWRVSADSVVVLRGRSRSTGTDFLRERVAFRGAALEGMDVDTAALEVAVEGNYMRAAVKALGEYTGRRIRVVSSGGAARSGAAAGDPGVAGSASGAGAVLRVADTSGGSASAGGSRAADSGAAVGTRVVRWRPEWQAAAWDGKLPVVLGELLFSGGGVEPLGGRLFRDSGVERSRDRRVIDPGQVAPVKMDGGVTKASDERVDLRPVLWGILFLLFLLERILVFRYDKA